MREPADCVQMKIVVARSPASADALGLLNDDCIDLLPSEHGGAGQAARTRAHDDHFVAGGTHRPTTAPELSRLASSRRCPRPKGFDFSLEASDLFPELAFRATAAVLVFVA